MELYEKLRDNFDEMVVYKDLKKTNFFSTLSLPAFMRDWLLKKFEDDEGEFDKDELARFVKKFIPRKDDWNAIKNDIIIEVRDGQTAIVSVMGFSIKSKFGQNATLFNAGSSSQFLFKLSNCNDQKSEAKRS